jgi:hypothetical protein
MGLARWGMAVALVGAAVACAGETPVAGTVAASSDTTPTPDSIPEERPDTIKAVTPDSVTMLVALLPAAPDGALEGESASQAERAVFVPRTQRWFMARWLDGALLMDVGRIDGGVGTSDEARAAFDRMVAARSPLQTGMRLVAHPRAGATIATVSGFRLIGRRIVAVLSDVTPDSTERAVAAEWRGPTPAAAAPRPSRCEPGDTTAIAAAIARYTAPPKEALSVIRGCFGSFRALLTIRPLEITPESIEKVVLVRATGTTRSGRLRDLSYPLHELVSVTDVDGDGTDELVVHSFRPAMETWATLRMTDSVTFTRFASGFTLEKR